jgi:orotate phosphoribosyltransferase
MKNLEKEIAKSLLQIKAIKLSPARPFTWASGWKSPIYCDNRQILSFPEIRTKVTNAFVQLAKVKFPEAEVIAGVATGAIAPAVLVAEQLSLPFVYVRPAPKGHGMGNRVEGVIHPRQRVLVIEDLISTGQSSLQAVQALRDKGAEVIGMLAIFSYDFDQALENFMQANCRLFTLSNYHALIVQAIADGIIDDSFQETLAKWRKDPSRWK